MRRPAYEHEPEEIDEAPADEAPEFFADSAQNRIETPDDEDSATRFRQLADIMMGVINNDPASMWDDSGDEEGAGEGPPPPGRGQEEEEGADSALAQAKDVLASPSPWECAPAATASVSEGWAQFSSDGFGSDPFAQAPPSEPAGPAPAAGPVPAAGPAPASNAFDTDPFWGFQSNTDVAKTEAAPVPVASVASVSSGMEALSVHDDSSLASHVLTAMNSLSAATLATLGQDLPEIMPATAEHQSNTADSVSESANSVSESVSVSETCDTYSEPEASGGDS